METVDIKTIVSEWQTCVNLADSISKRRDHMNNIFITLNIAFITSIMAIQNFNNILTIIIGVLITIIWTLLILNYRQLNKAKFKVINELEKKLPYQPMNKEYEYLKSNKKYCDFSLIELLIPTIFCIFYIAFYFIM